MMEEDDAGIGRLKHVPDHGAALLFGFLFTAGVVTGKPLRQLKGPEIKARFSGQEFMAAMSWGLIFSEGGCLVSVEMGGRMTAIKEDPSIGHWQVEDDELCLDLGPGRSAVLCRLGLGQDHSAPSRRGGAPGWLPAKAESAAIEPRRRARDGGDREELSKRWIGTRGFTAGAVWSTGEADVREGAPLSHDGPGRPAARQHVFRGLVRQPGRPIQDGFSGSAVRGNEVNQQKIYFEPGAP